MLKKTLCERNNLVSEITSLLPSYLEHLPEEARGISAETKKQDSFTPEELAQLKELSLNELEYELRVGRRAYGMPSAKQTTLKELIHEKIVSPESLFHHEDDFKAEDFYKEFSQVSLPKKLLGLSHLPNTSPSYYNTGIDEQKVVLLRRITLQQSNERLRRRRSS